jgi:hypothetical protein
LMRNFRNKKNSLFHLFFSAQRIENKTERVFTEKKF